ISASAEGKTATQPLRVWPQPIATITVDPASVSVPQFHKVRFTATARDRRGNILTDRPITWSSSAPTVFYIKPNADTAAGKDLGNAVVSATAEGKSGTSDVTVTNPVEARALWVTRFEFTTSSAVDFPKIATIFQKAASANFNVVYFQVRAAGDAFYYSSIEPCSPRMCTTLGGPRPSRDPLEFALAEAAKYGIEVHAWLNAYTGFISGSTTACSQFINSTPPNWLKANPSWSMSTKNFSTGAITRQVDNCATTSEYMWVSPGIPQVRDQLAVVAADVARRYGPKGLKGIHLDRIRYPNNTFSYDSQSQEAFRASTGAYPSSNSQATWLDFRRGFVNQGVQEVYQAVRAVDPSMVLSAAVFPGYKPRTGWSANWSFTDLFQDPQAWAQGGYLDVEVPMNYPATSTSLSWTVKAYCSNTDWTCVMDDHIDRIEKQAGRQVYVGVGAIKGWTEMSKQIDLAHDRSATGLSVYSFSQVDAIPSGWAQLAAGPFKYKAAIPTMGWK
nr:family 10 glycosylhydrolase [Gemmatimonadaceae bacterium]